jgi:hypothetical protein
MKIHAARRLLAADMTLRNLLNIDGDLISLHGNRAQYKLTTALYKAMQILDKRLGSHKEGKQGSTDIYVWEVPNLGVCIYSPSGGDPTLEIYDR